MADLCGSARHFRTTWDSPRRLGSHAVQRHGFRAAYWPLGDDADAATVRAYADAAARGGHRDRRDRGVEQPAQPRRVDPRRRARAVQARGSSSPTASARAAASTSPARARTAWDGPHPDNLSRETFALIVDTVREIIDAVEPRRTFYTLEPMPWSLPDSPDSYLELLRRDRPAAVRRPPRSGQPRSTARRSSSTTPASCASASRSSARTSSAATPRTSCSRASSRSTSPRSIPGSGRARLPRAAHGDGPPGPRHADPRRAPDDRRGVRRGRRAHPQRGRRARACRPELAHAVSSSIPVSSQNTRHVSSGARGA